VVSIYDSFTIPVLITLEDLGFCAKGQGGKLVADGNLISGVGRLPFNTDGGGLCSNHPGNRGGLTKVVEAVRQLRGEAHPKVQVRNCDVALAHGTGGSPAATHGRATLVLGGEGGGGGRGAHPPHPHATPHTPPPQEPTWCTNTSDCALDAIRIGQAVRVAFKPTDGGPPVP